MVSLAERSLSMRDWSEYVTPLELAPLPLPTPPQRRRWLNSRKVVVLIIGIFVVIITVAGLSTSVALLSLTNKQQCISFLDYSTMSNNNNSDRHQEARNHYFSNYLCRGYNIFYANPHSSTNKADPGYRLQVFDLQTAGRGGGIVFMLESTLKSSSKAAVRTELIKNARDYSKMLLESSYFGSGSDNFFVANPDFKRVAKQTSKEKFSCFIETWTTRSSYTAQLDEYFRQNLTKDFLMAVSLLPPNNNNSTTADYEQFFERFGTHFVDQAAFGTIFGEQFLISQEEISRRNESEIVGIFDAFFKENLYSGKLQQKLSGFNLTNRLEFGTRLELPMANNSLAEDQSMPVKISLKPISSLLSIENFPNDTKIELKRLLLESALASYCETWLLPKGSVDSCQHSSEKVVVAAAIESGQFVVLRQVDRNLPLGAPQMRRDLGRCDSQIYTRRKGYDSTMEKQCDTGYYPSPVLTPNSLKHSLLLSLQLERKGNNYSSSSSPPIIISNGDVVRIVASWSPLPKKDVLNCYTITGNGNYSEISTTSLSQQWRIHKPAAAVNLNKTTALIYSGDLVYFENVAAQGFWLSIWETESHPNSVGCWPPPGKIPGWIVEQ